MADTDTKSPETLLREAVKCLYLELPADIADDVSAKVDAVLAMLEKLRTIQEEADLDQAAHAWVNALELSFPIIDGVRTFNEEAALEVMTEVLAAARDEAPAGFKVRFEIRVQTPTGWFNAHKYANLPFAPFPKMGYFSGDPGDDGAFAVESVEWSAQDNMFYADVEAHEHSDREFTLDETIEGWRSVGWIVDPGDVAREP